MLLTGLTAFVLLFYFVGLGSGEAFGIILDITGGVSGTLTAFILPSLMYLSQDWTKAEIDADGKGGQAFIDGKEEDQKNLISVGTDSEWFQPGVEVGGQDRAQGGSGALSFYWLAWLNLILGLLVMMSVVTATVLNAV